MRDYLPPTTCLAKEQVEGHLRYIIRDGAKLIAVLPAKEGKALADKTGLTLPVFLREAAYLHEDFVAAIKHNEQALIA